VNAADRQPEGAVARPTIALLHGAFADAASWNGVIALLEQQGYTVLTMAGPPAADPAQPAPHSRSGTVRPGAVPSSRRAGPKPRPGSGPGARPGPPSPSGTSRTATRAGDRPVAAEPESVAETTVRVLRRPGRGKRVRWRDYAACRDVDPELFFPAGSTGPGLLQVSRAKLVCAACPVRVPCLEWALASRQEAGVWGGTSEDERQALQRTRR
jgi:WhiB family transcriptional regulator, redox-sensing transcriptional regulator